MTKHSKTVIVICGPTAVGKTALAVDLAHSLKTQIISADSRQCYKELNIGVAKPNLQQLSAVHHYFINSHSIHESVDAAVFENYALQALAQIFDSHDHAILVGGTGLYLKALAEGMDHIPATDSNIRQQIILDYQTHGLRWLQQQVAAKDPVFWQSAEQQNPQRLMRGLEVVLSTGKSITTFRRGHKKQRPFHIIMTGIELPRALLCERINRRVDDMIAAGLPDEVKSLRAHQNVNALQTVGYSELFDYFDGKIDLSGAIEKIKTNTRHYAKRQMTWFKKNEQIEWFSPSGFKELYGL